MMTVAATETRDLTSIPPSKKVQIYNRFEAVMQLKPLDRKLDQQAWWIAAILFVASLQSWLILTHEPWSDEWQALGIAVQSPTMRDLLHNLRYEGHPAVWYLILRGLAAIATQARDALPWAAMIVAVVTQACILLTAPFKRSERLLIALNQFFLFEFLTVSRSLSLGAMVGILTVSLWNRRRASWFALALLPQCDFLFGVVALALIYLRRRQQRWWWPGVGLFLVSAVLAAWTVRPMPDIIPAGVPKAVSTGVLVWFYRTSTIGIPFQILNGKPIWSTGPAMQLVPYAWALIILVVRESLKNDREKIVILAMFSSFTLFFSLFVYELSVRHLAIIFLLFIAMLWVRSLSGSSTHGPFFRLWLLISAACGLSSVAISAVMPFDTAYLAAREIRVRGLQDRQWMAYLGYRGTSVSYLNGMTFQPVGLDCTTDFVRWNYKQTKTESQFRQEIDQFARQHGRYYLLADLPLDQIAPQLRRFAYIPGGYNGGAYYLFEIGSGLPDAARTTKRCNGPVRAVPNLRPVSPLNGKLSWRISTSSKFPAYSPRP